MHLERSFLREYFTALLAHEADIVRPQIVIVQLEFEREGIVAHATFERSVTTMIGRYMMILANKRIPVSQNHFHQTCVSSHISAAIYYTTHQQGNIFECPVAILAG